MEAGQGKDEWVRQILGVDPASYAAPPTAAAPQAAPTVAPPAPVPPPLTSAQWTTANSTAMTTLTDAAARVVMPGPAVAAQARLSAARQAIAVALAANNTTAATAALAAAQADCRLVVAQPDAAMGPVTKGQHPDQVLFGKETTNALHTGAPDTQDIQVSDVNQGQIGDCYLLSTLGEIARIKPDVIRDMIKDNKDGTYTVTLFKHKGGVSGFFAGVFGGNDLTPVQVTVDSNFGTNTVNNQAQQSQVGNQHEIWVQVVEKAYAKLNGGYDKITHGGWPADTMEATTGKKAEKKSITKITVADLEADLKSGKPVVMDTIAQPNPNVPLAFNMFGPHAYMLDSIVTTPQGKVVILKNPWGTGDPPPIPFNQLQQSVWQIETGSTP